MSTLSKSQEHLIALEAERAQLISEGWYLQHCWLVQVKPGGTARTDRQYWQARSRQPIFDGKTLKHLKTDEEVNDYRAAIERGRQLKQIKRQIDQVQQRLRSLAATQNSSSPSLNTNDSSPELEVINLQPSIEPDLQSVELIEQEKMVQAVIATSRQLRESLRQALTRSQTLGAKNLKIRESFAPIFPKASKKSID